jgi:hypothetical protein
MVNSRASLKDYCLRKLGFPVIDINVDEDQVDDRVDDALQRYAQFHYDGTHHDYLAIQMTAEMLANAQDHANSTGDVYTDTKGWVPMPADVIGVRRMFPISSGTQSSGGSGSNFNIFDLNYQLRLNELYEFISSSYTYYWIARSHIRTLELLLIGQNPVRFSRHMGRLYIDMQWGAPELAVGTWFIIECDRVLDPDEFVDVYNDMWLKEYTTQLIKKQWGENLKKYGNYTLPGGMIINGVEIYNEANAEILRLEQQLRDVWEEPPKHEIG